MFIFIITTILFLKKTIWLFILGGGKGKWFGGTAGLLVPLTDSIHWGGSLHRDCSLHVFHLGGTRGLGLWYIQSPRNCGRPIKSSWGWEGGTGQGMRGRALLCTQADFSDGGRFSHFLVGRAESSKLPRMQLHGVRLKKKKLRRKSRARAQHHSGNNDRVLGEPGGWGAGEKERWSSRSKINWSTHTWQRARMSSCVQWLHEISYWQFIF